MANTSKVLSDVFFGTQQSRYAAIAYFITIAIICFAVIFSSSDVPIEQRFVVVLFILIITIPSVLFSLFELTCIVTGGNENTRWWCYWLGWFLSIMLIIYCLFIIISLFFSMSSYDLAVSRINDDENQHKIDKIGANNYAKDVMKKYDEDIANNQISVDTEMQQSDMQQHQMQQSDMQQHQMQQHQMQQSDMQQHQMQQSSFSRPLQTQPIELTPVMSNDQNVTSGFDSMEYDKYNNYAPISNVPSNMSDGYVQVTKSNNDYMKINETHNNQNNPTTLSNEPLPFDSDNNLQPY